MHFSKFSTFVIFPDTIQARDRVECFQETNELMTDLHNECLTVTSDGDWWVSVPMMRNQVMTCPEAVEES